MERVRNSWSSGLKVLDRDFLAINVYADYIDINILKEEEKVAEIIQDATFDKAMQMDLIEYDKGYKWKGTLGELALFAELLSEN